MSRINVDALHSEDGANSNIELDDSRNTTCKGNLTVDGNIAVTGTGVTDTLSNRRLNINGSMQISQRGNSTGVASDGYFGPDRYKWQRSGATVDISQDTDVPAGEGFSNSLKIDVTTADDQSATAGALHQTHYFFEGYDVQRLRYGTANAKTLKLTFWVKSPKTGTHWVRLYSENHTRMNNKKYTVSSANTWEKKTLTFAGDTSNGFTNGNAKALRLTWWWSAGSNYTSGSDSDGSEWAAYAATNQAVGQVNCVDNAANNIYLTGVQLEETTATDFEHRSYGDELARCQRYFYMHCDGSRHNEEAIGIMSAYGTNQWYCYCPFPVTMRSGTPSLYKVVGSNYFALMSGSGDQDLSDDIDTTAQEAATGYFLKFTDDVSNTTGHAGHAYIANAAARIGFSAEL